MEKEKEMEKKREIEREMEREREKREKEMEKEKEMENKREIEREMEKKKDIEKEREKIKEKEKEKEKIFTDPSIFSSIKKSNISKNFDEIPLRLSKSDIEGVQKKNWTINDFQLFKKKLGKGKFGTVLLAKLLFLF